MLPHVWRLSLNVRCGRCAHVGADSRGTLCTCNGAWVRAAAEGPLGASSVRLMQERCCGHPRAWLSRHILAGRHSGAVCQSIRVRTAPASAAMASFQSSCTNVHAPSSRGDFRMLFHPCLSDGCSPHALIQSRQPAHTHACGALPGGERPALLVLPHSQGEVSANAAGCEGARQLQDSCCRHIRPQGFCDFKLGDLPIVGLQQLLYWGVNTRIGASTSPFWEGSLW